MNAFLLNGAPAVGDATDVVAAATAGMLGGAGWDVRTATLRDLTVADCTGCFGCWLKTPGECVIDDDGRAIAAAFVASDLAFYVTPISFGGYGSLLKSAVDRMVPLVSCFFQKIDGEVHHRPRYGRYPNFLAIGVLRDGCEAEGDVFRHLVARNAINFHVHKHEAVVLRPGLTPEVAAELVTRALATMEDDR